MARKARIISENGLYHIYFKGSGRLFKAQEDYDKFEQLLYEAKSSIELYAYGLTAGDGHLFIKTSVLSAAMKKLFTDYAAFYNRKYNHEGAVFCSRYKSEPVKPDYAAGLTRYIIKNKKRSSNLFEEGITDSYYIKQFFESDAAMREFFRAEETETYGADCGVNTADIKLRIDNCLGQRKFLSLSQKERASVLNSLLESGITKSRLARFLGISRGTIINCLAVEKADLERRRREEIVIL